MFGEKLVDLDNYSCCLDITCMKMRNADLSAFLMLILGYFPTGKLE